MKEFNSEDLIKFILDPKNWDTVKLNKKELKSLFGCESYGYIKLNLSINKNKDVFIDIKETNNVYNEARFLEKNIEVLGLENFGIVALVEGKTSVNKLNTYKINNRKDLLTLTEKCDKNTNIELLVYADYNELKEIVNNLPEPVGIKDLRKAHEEQMSLAPFQEITLKYLPKNANTFKIHLN